jgi:hypothetical protein
MGRLISRRQRHRAELHQPVTIAFEMLGCAGPAWLTKGGIVVPFYADRQLVALAEQLAVQHPEWSVYATQINGGNTEMADALSRVYAAIMILNGVGHNLATLVTGRYRTVLREE